MASMKSGIVTISDAGFTKKQALALASEMTGNEYGPPDLDRATLVLEVWKETQANATIVRDSDS
jgi:hypothetical protein